MGQSRPRESRRRRRRRAGGAGMKSGKGRAEARTSFQGKVRAFSLADRLGERGKRLQQRLRLLALGARHLADSAAPRGVPLRPGVAPASDGGAETHGANIVASDRPPRIFPLGGFQAKDPRAESSERGPKTTSRGAAPWVGSPRTARRSRSASSASNKRRTGRTNTTTRSSGAARPPPPLERPLRLPRHHPGNITRPFRRPRLRPPRPAHRRPAPVSRPRARASRLRPNPDPRRPTPSSPTVGTTARR